MWQDESGVWCRALVDWLPDVAPGGRLIVADYKTAASADPDTWARAAASYGYHQQDAWYLAGVEALGLNPDDPDVRRIFEEEMNGGARDQR